MGRVASALHFYFLQGLFLYCCTTVRYGTVRHPFLFSAQRQNSDLELFCPGWPCYHTVPIVRGHFFTDSGTTLQNRLNDKRIVSNWLARAFRPSAKATSAHCRAVARFMSPPPAARTTPQREETRNHSLYVLYPNLGRIQNHGHGHKIICNNCASTIRHHLSLDQSPAQNCNTQCILLS